MAEVGRFISNTIVRHNQANIELNMNGRNESIVDTLPDLLLLQQRGPILKFDLRIKRYDQLQTIHHNLHGVPRRTTQTPLRPVLLNRRVDFPLHRSSTYLTRFLSSIPLIPPHLVDQTVFRISDQVFASYNPRAAVIHLTADLTVMNVTTVLHNPPVVHPILLAQLPDPVWIIDDSIVVDAGEPEPDDHELPRQRRKRSARDLKERYGFRASDIDCNLGDCVVCLEQLAENNNSSSSRDNYLLKMPCSHVFHCRCISKWLQTNDTCPLCRSVIP